MGTDHVILETENVPHLGMQRIDALKGPVTSTHVDGLSLDLYEIDGEPVVGLTLYSVDAGVGFVRPMGEECMRSLAQSLLDAVEERNRILRERNCV